MINLLPPEKQEIILREKFSRLLFVFLLGLAFILFSALVSLLPAFVYLDSKNKEAARELKAIEQSRVFKDVQEIEKGIRELNQKIALIQKNKTLVAEPSVFLEKLLEHKNKGIKINSFDYSFLGALPVVSLKGISAARASFLAYSAKLKNEPLIKSVNSPIANILKEKDFDFGLTIEFIKQ